MKKGWIALIIVGVLLLIGYIWFKGMYNKMVDLNENTTGQWAKVESSYQRRTGD